MYMIFSTDFFFLLLSVSLTVDGYLLLVPASSKSILPSVLSEFLKNHQLRCLSHAFLTVFSYIIFPNYSGSSIPPLQHILISLVLFFLSSPSCQNMQVCPRFFLSSPCQKMQVCPRIYFLPLKPCS